MNKNQSIIPLLLFLTAALSGAAQSSLTRTVADAATRTPIAYAYVYHADARRTGTLTNADGRFYLPRVKPTDTLVVSHIGYAPFRVVVGEIAGDTLFLTEKVTTLAGVTILGVDSLSLYELVKANLEKNHGVGPVTYDVFARSFQYDRPGSELYTIQEMVMKVHQDAKHKVKVNFERARSRAFADEDKSFSYHLVFELLRPFEDNLMDSDLWDKKVFKKFTLAMDGTVSQDARTLVRLVFTSKEDTNRVITLYIDQKTYAVVRYNYT